MLDKPTLRRYMRERLRTVDEESRRQQGHAITQHILALSRQWPCGTTVSLFGGLKNEPDFLSQVLPAMNAGGLLTCLFQVLENGEMQAQWVRGLDELHRGPMNVWEPRPECAVVPAAELDFILVPGLAFTRAGHRIGRGAGFYDRYLSQPECRAQLIGVTTDLQLVDEIPTEPHDQRVGQIITESGLLPPCVSC